MISSVDGRFRLFKKIKNGQNIYRPKEGVGLLIGIKK